MVFPNTIGSLLQVEACFKSFSPPSQMKLDNSLLSANAANILDSLLPPKVTAIVTILIAFMLILASQYHSSTKSLKALRLLISDIDNATKDTVTGSVFLDAQFLDEVNGSRY
ncbi:hypothetical protein C8J56DRAFT_903360 [Mycena floridula]|nr:hypothetical protein C8J56DRAFT_903360 [Mycena floridula]